MNIALLKAATTETIMLDYLSVASKFTWYQALAEIVDICDIFSFALFRLAHDWQHVG